MCRSYTLAPSAAWYELGGPPLGPRARRRLTRAVSELPAIEHALAEVAKVRTKDDPLPDVYDVLLAEEVASLYKADLEASITDDESPDDEEVTA